VFVSNKDKLDQPPKVSVGMITYNHEQFIEQAVRSVMMQETDFDYELVIGEDCSADNTREIVLRLKDEFPGKIKLILHPKNVGMAANFVTVYRACQQGKYIALIDGDDYWTHPRKLQIQVDHMDSHTECRICVHSANEVDSTGETIETNGYKTVQDLEEYFKVSPKNIPTSSLLCRSPYEDLPDWFMLLKASADWPLHVWLLLQGGGICHLEDMPMSSRRIHAGGVSSFMKYNFNIMAEEEKRQRILGRIQQTINDQEIVCRTLPERFKHYLFKEIEKSYALLARTSYGHDQVVFRQAYAELCRLSPDGRYIPKSGRIAVVSRLLGYPRAEWLRNTYRRLIPSTGQENLRNTAL
jgi:hypothetical protein